MNRDLKTRKRLRESMSVEKQKETCLSMGGRWVPSHHTKNGVYIHGFCRQIQIPSKPYYAKIHGVNLFVNNAPENGKFPFDVSSSVYKVKGFGKTFEEAIKKGRAVSKKAAYHQDIDEKDL